MTLETHAEYEMTFIWIRRFEETVRRLEELKANLPEREQAGIAMEISGYRYMIDDLRSQVADYEVRAGALAKAA